MPGRLAEHFKSLTDGPPAAAAASVALMMSAMPRFDSSSTMALQQPPHAQLYATDSVCGARAVHALVMCPRGCWCWVAAMLPHMPAISCANCQGRAAGFKTCSCACYCLILSSRLLPAHDGSRRCHPAVLHPPHLSQRRPCTSGLCSSCLQSPRAAQSSLSYSSTTIKASGARARCTRKDSATAARRWACSAAV